ncbi:MAG: hypothetical protein COU22_00450 [Candidatus Komeilibacteria bacterium CG10_big_fil_rev_8_21_14_0_10_41_13]|uniref:Uncharacterized protein n=1 Tax=Candidatus Komeilibacteria bacterium CG10_big_fil_rev_8_21_14_0_10_41_13 TaxID=1974476 RepID=A0A2M6WD78_9BACT|nr:MAG: hypothetical protein COU22_00450 [Candidatus Komeilibacteria bacterium CG10_big_fil_rev_8_21_14_0_10_41_13]
MIIVNLYSSAQSNVVRAVAMELTVKDFIEDELHQDCLIYNEIIEGSQSTIIHLFIESELIDEVTTAFLNELRSKFNFDLYVTEMKKIIPKN